MDRFYHWNDCFWKENDRNQEDYRGVIMEVHWPITRAKSKGRKGEEEDSVWADWTSLFLQL